MKKWLLPLALLLLITCHLLQLVIANNDVTAVTDVSSIVKLGKKALKELRRKEKHERKGGRRRDATVVDLDTMSVDWGIRVGTMPNTDDVYAQPLSDKHPWGDQVVDDGLHVVNHTSDFTTFWVSLLPDKSRTMMMQRPVVFTDKEGCDARLSDWPSSSSQSDKRKYAPRGRGSNRKEWHRSMFLTPVPNMDRDKNPVGMWTNETELRFTVQYACEKKVLQKVTLKMRFFQIMDNDKRESHDIRVNWIKQCDAAKNVDETQTALPGFFVGTTASNDDVVRDGIATSRYEIPNDESDDDTHLLLVPGTASSSTYYVRYLSNTGIQVNAASVVVHDPAILQVEVGGRMAKESQELGSQAVDLELSYRCREAGESIVTVAFKSKDRDRMNVLFAIKKKCSGATADEGVVINGLNIGVGVSNKLGTDVMFNGVAAALYAPTLEKDKKRVVIPASEKVTTFWLSLAKDTATLAFGDAMATADSLTKTSTAAPVVTLQAKDVSSTMPTQFQVEYHCTGRGMTDVTVVIPVKPQGNIVFVIRKDCEPTTQEQQDESNADTNLQPIPGVIIGLKEPGTSGVAVDGLPLPAWHWNASDEDLALVKKNPFITFFIALNTSVPNAAEVELGVPVLLQSLPITQPIVGGRGSNGAKLDGKGGTAISITFHCLTNGTTTMTLAIPVISIAGGTARKEPIKLTFLKECALQADTPSQGLGGLHLPGFSIGTAPHLSDVVLNGFPLPTYFGRRPAKWRDIMIPAKVDSTRFYIRYNQSSIEAHDEIGDEISFQAPSIINHRPIAAAVASGDASRDTTLVQGGEPEELDITYHCKYQGVVGITVTIPILPHGRILFTIPKQCSGPSLPRGEIVPGFNVGTAPGLADVVKDGETIEGWMATSGERTSLIVRPDEFATTFYVQKTGPQVLGLEPEILAHRPICNPTIDHELHVSDDNDDDEEDIVEIVIGNQTQAINISYNCVWADDSVITVAIQLLPRGKVQWSWTKHCEFNNDDFPSDELSSSDDVYGDDEDNDADIEPLPSGAIDGTPSEDIPADDDSDDDDGDYYNFADIDPNDFIDVDQQRDGLGIDYDAYVIADGAQDDTDAQPSDDNNAADDDDDASDDNDDDDSNDMTADPEQAARDAAAAAAAGSATTNKGGASASTSTDDDDTSSSTDVTYVRPPSNAAAELCIGTSHSIILGKRCDVMNDGQAMNAYAAKNSKNDKSDERTAASLTRDQTKVAYYITLADQEDESTSQKFEAPTIKMSKPGIVTVRASGSAAAGGTLKDSDMVILALDFECLSPGRTSILISIPLVVPNLAANKFQSFSIFKTCGGRAFHRVDDTWTVSRILTAAAGVLFFTLAVASWMYYQRKNKSVAYTAVLTQPTNIQSPRGTTVVHDDSD